ncbi:MAG: AlbA family DNA-binding domain-containing protein [bacterium]
MAIDSSTISLEQKKRILHLEEGHFVDLKAIEITPAKLTRHISAFANADGGELYIGIDEDKVTSKRSWRGFSSFEVANGHIQIFEKLFPLGENFVYTFLTCAHSSGIILQIVIHKTPDIKHASDGKSYVRRGAQSLPVDTPEDLDRLRQNKRILVTGKSGLVAKLDRTAQVV